MPLRKGHRSRVEPGVDHLRCAAHHPLLRLPRACALGTRPRIDVYVWLVRVEILRELAPPPLSQTLVAPDGFDVRRIAVAHPERERRPPVAVARERPVDVVLEPLAEAPRSGLRRMPVH